jgi:hypothetical protein
MWSSVVTEHRRTGAVTHTWRCAATQTPHEDYVCFNKFSLLHSVRRDKREQRDITTERSENIWYSCVHKYHSPFQSLDEIIQRQFWAEWAHHWYQLLDWTLPSHAAAWPISNADCVNTDTSTNQPQYTRLAFWMYKTSQTKGETPESLPISKPSINNIFLLLNFCYCNHMKCSVSEAAESLKLLATRNVPFGGQSNFLHWSAATGGLHSRV